MAACLFVLLLLHVALAQQLQVSGALGSHMVLQRAPARARVWGWAMAGVSINMQVAREDGELWFEEGTVADVNGTWIVAIPPTEAGGPYTISITDHISTFILRDILFGDVWFCAGQSNMEMTISQCFNAAEELEDSRNYPDIRVFSVLRNAETIAQNNVVSRNPAGWGAASPSTLGAAEWDYFSATCYYFGRTLHQKTGVPQGLVVSAWSGTRIQAWMSPESLLLCNTSDKEDTALLKENQDEPTDPQAPSALWNGMVVPLLNMAFIGVNWYQASANTNEPILYSCLFPTLISDWRKQFGNELYFYYTQLGPYNADQLLPAIRQAQQSGLTLGNTGRGVILDLWDPDSPYGDIHARQKQVVGYRAALHALVQRYQQTQIDADGPRLLSVRYKDSENATLVALFQSQSSQQLTYGGIDFCNICCNSQTTSLEVRSKETGLWQNVVTASIQGLEVLIQVPSSAGAVDELRYAWADINQCILFDSNGLPAEPFSVPVQAFQKTQFM